MNDKVSTLELDTQRLAEVFRPHLRGRKKKTKSSITTLHPPVSVVALYAHSRMFYCINVVPEVRKTFDVTFVVTTIPGLNQLGRSAMKQMGFHWTYALSRKRWSLSSASTDYGSGCFTSEFMSKTS